MTVTQTVEIPDSHRLTIDIPRKEPDGSLDDALEKIRALCKDAPISVDSFREERRRDTELEETRYWRFFPMTGDDA